MNKEYPKILNYRQYRPIIVSSPCVKFLEGLFIGKLRNYVMNKLNKWQIGFVPRLSIDDCKDEVFNKMEQLKYR